MPSCIHTTFAPCVIASSVTPPESSGLRKISTISTLTGSSFKLLYTSSPSISWPAATGLIGKTLNPFANKYFIAKKLGLFQLELAPTIAMVSTSDNIFFR